MMIDMINPVKQGSEQFAERSAVTNPIASVEKTVGVMPYSEIPNEALRAYFLPLNILGR